MTEIVFRAAVRDDVEAIVDLLADDHLGQTREDASRPLNDRYVSAFEACDTDPNQLLAVVCDGDTIVGCLQITFIPGLSHTGQWRGQIESVRIAASHRGSGLGHQVFEWAIEQCRARGCGLIQLTSDKTRPDAIRFYESLGFTASHVGFKMRLNPS